MRRASTFHLRQSFMELKLTSLIDVVFLLLIFFVWTASFRIAEYVLPSSVSESTAVARGGGTLQPPPPEADFADVVVRVRWTGIKPVWSINDELLPTLAAVQSKLALVFSANDEAPVVIFPDSEVPLGDVIDLYDIARLVGFSQVQFAAAVEPSPEPAS